MEVITSLDNKKIKNICRLQEKKYRDEVGLFLVETNNILEGAYNSNLLEEVYVLEGYECNYEVPKYYVSLNVMKKISSLSSPGKVVGVVKKLPELPYKNRLLILDNIQDPGNLGTILRTVDSVGVNQILVSKGTADSYNPKVVRSTMGAIFRVKIIECEDLKKTLKEIKKHKFKIVVSSFQTENTIYDINYYKKVIIIGNEANGVEQQIQEIADEKIKIPMIRKNRKLKCISSNRNYFV